MAAPPPLAEAERQPLAEEVESPVAGTVMGRAEKAESTVVRSSLKRVQPEGGRTWEGACGRKGGGGCEEVWDAESMADGAERVQHNVLCAACVHLPLDPLPSPSPPLPVWYLESSLQPPESGVQLAVDGLAHAVNVLGTHLGQKSERGGIKSETQ